MRAHRRDPRKKDLEKGAKISYLTYEESRILEQMLMVYHHTRNFAGEDGRNLINGVSEKKIDMFTTAAEALFNKDFWSNELEELFLEFTDMKLY